MNNPIHADSGAPEMTEKSTDQFQFGTWYPIETAPKDGNDFLACTDDFSLTMLVVAFDDSADPDFPWGTLDGPNYHLTVFSHWMPLPPPPPVISQSALETCGHEEAP